MKSCADKMLEAIEHCKKIKEENDIKLDSDFIVLVNPKGSFAIPVSEVLRDGFISEGIVYTFLPFVPVDTTTLVELEKIVNKQTTH